MNDLLNNSTKPKNIEELYYKILEIISDLYEKYIPQSVKNRKNKEKAKMTDAEIISVQCQVVLVEPKTNDKWIDEED